MSKFTKEETMDKHGGAWREEEERRSEYGTKCEKNLGRGMLFPEEETEAQKSCSACGLVMVMG